MNSPTRKSDNLEKEDKSYNMRAGSKNSKIL